MTRLCILALLILVFIGSTAYAAPEEMYIRLQIDHPKDIVRLSKIMSIDNVIGDTVYAYVVGSRRIAFERADIEYERLPHPGTLIQPKMMTEPATKDAQAWDSYPDYPTYLAMMAQFAADYPGLCELVNIGTSVEGRDMLFLKISDNVGIEEDEPGVMYTGTMHGDETTGYVMLLRLADSLLSTYGVDSMATRLVDSCEIWINPLANPDGTFAGGNSSVYGATRQNANGYDLNRNFPDPDDGPNPNGPYQPETLAMMAFAEAETFAISANFHGGTEVFNYPWDTWSRLCPDDAWWQYVGHQFADSAQYYSPSGYMDGFDDGITNGYAWYTIDGGRQDFMNYWYGCREVTAEISDVKLVSASQLPAHWNYLRTSLFNYLEQGLYGIRGVVTDSITGEPLAAVIKVLDHDTDIDSSRIFTDPDVGDYHRLIEPGTYSIVVSSPGYYSKQIDNIVVNYEQGVRRDVALAPLPNDPVLHYVGNDAGPIGAGDTVYMHITMENLGAVAASGVSAILSSDDPYITVTQNYSTFPLIAAINGIETSDAIYQFEVSGSCPSNYLADFRLDVTATGHTDSLFFTLLVGQTVEDFESGDFTQLPWESGGAGSWTVGTIGPPFNGDYCAQSAPIGDSKYTDMKITVDVLAPGQLKFFYMVSSEEDFDYFRFYDNGLMKVEASGTVPWTEAIIDVQPGTHTFKWRYIKDYGWSGGSDRAWVDLIVFPPIHVSNPPSIQTQLLPDWTAQIPYSQQLTATGGTGQLTWSDKNGDLAGTGLTLQADGLVSGTPGVSGPIAFTAEVSDTASQIDERPYSFTINAAVSITTDTIIYGQTDEPISYQIVAAGGTGALVWSDVNSDLDGTGLNLSPAGLVSGTVTQAGEIPFFVRATDNIGAYDQRAMTASIEQAYLCGDANGDESVNVADGVFIINFVFKGGTNPDPEEAADANCDSGLNVGDAVYVINYVFKGGPAPCCP